MRKNQQKITADQGITADDWQELWQRRELLWVLVRRDLQVRYKNTALGVLWVVLQPLLAAGIFTLIFAKILAFGNGETNYLVYTFLGFMFWQFFSSSLTIGAQTIYEQIAMVKKIYFPRLYLPLTIVCRNLFDFFVSGGLLVIIMLWQEVRFSWIGLVGFFLTILILTIFTSGCSFILASLNARYRDFRHLTPFILQIWFYATPVFYPESLLSGNLAWIGKVNLVAQFLHLVRAAIFEQQLNYASFGWLFLLSSGVFLLGVWLFKKMETAIVDWT